MVPGSLLAFGPELVTHVRVRICHDLTVITLMKGKPILPKHNPYLQPAKDRRTNLLTLPVVSTEVGYNNST